MYTMDEKLISVVQQELVQRAKGDSFLRLDPKRYPEHDVKERRKNVEMESRTARGTRSSLPVQRSLLLRILSILIKF